MNFVDDEELAKRFKENEVPSLERLFYFVIQTTLISIFIIISRFDTPNPDGWSVWIDIFYAFVNFLVIVILYNTNSKGDDREFIERYICIGFPVFIQISLIYLSFIVLNFVSDSLGIVSLETVDSDIGAFIASIMGTAYLYFRLNRCLKIASGISKPNPPSPASAGSA